MTAQQTIDTCPNEAAAAYIRGKAVADPKNFGDLPAQLKQRAFTVAGIEQMDALRRIRDAIAKLPGGASWDEAKREIAAEISPYVRAEARRPDMGEDGGADAGRPNMKAARARAEFLLRTQGFQAYAVARHQEQTATADVLPYWKYETVGDSRVRAAHAALDGKVLRADDPWWKTHYPPWDWGCRCIVVALDEEDAQEAGISKSADMPTPQRSESFSFDPTNAAIDLDALQKSRDEADWKLFAAKCRQAMVQADGREPETMWELMLDEKARKEARAEARRSDRDGRERAVVWDFLTGRKLGDATGDARGVTAPHPETREVCTLHTHPTGDNTPSPADLLTGYRIGSKVDYIAAGKKLRRWQWLKTPEPEDARRIRQFDEDNNAGRIDIRAYQAFLARLVDRGYIKMEEIG